ncbi:MAG: oxygen-dependent coproporphyrinogen oxidase [Ferruginibacter sp.]|nr:oxygen-dependent coproporphyrinogen oxidase [Cytophagales bacterium]
MDKEYITDWFRGLQDRICAALEGADGKGRFERDAWERPGGGGGLARVIRRGNILEKGGVNFSAVHGETPAQLLGHLQPELGMGSQPGLRPEGATLADAPRPGPDFYATGVSIVLHPYNPMVPIIHMNVRYFEMSTGVRWFGGGIDLTPHYVDEEDARYFHGRLRAVCDRHHPAYYSRFKAWADDYFYLKHRQETRGIGGIFFDHLAPDASTSAEEIFAFVRDVGDCLAPLYTHLMRKNAGLAFGEPEKQWQSLRRGRYVEFNLVWDRGTKFGLDTDGRTESILMSLPPHAQWEYDHRPEPGSRERATLNWLRKGVAWA